MSTNTFTIRPGFLIGLKTIVRGGVAYTRTDLETTDKKEAKWETTRVLDDPEEHARATKMRSKAGNVISKVCSRTLFGLLCPESEEALLDQAITEASAICKTFNETSKFTKIDVYTIKGRIEPSDEKAARAIGQEVAQLITEMNAGIDKLDPEAIRAAALKAKQMSGILSEEKSATIGEAVKAARKAANMIVKRIQSDGEESSIVLKDVQRGALEKARLSFLDLGDDAEVSGETAPVRTRTVEMDDDEVEAAEVRRASDAIDTPVDLDVPECTQVLQ